MESLWQSGTRAGTHTPQAPGVLRQAPIYTCTMLLHLAAITLGLSPTLTSNANVRLLPQRLSRLVLPVYGAEHLLIYSHGVKAESRVLPVLLRYREGEQIEQLAIAPPSGAAGLECMARGRLFEAITQRRLAPWDLMSLGSGCNSFSEALLRCLAQNGWKPRSVGLGAVTGSGFARYREAAVSQREMGMFTEAAPASVRVGELDTVLRCSREGASDELILALDGPGEAVLLAAAFGGGEGLPFETTETTWERRAVAVERLPELQTGRCTELNAVF
jgi:hypothetical protein